VVAVFGQGVEREQNCNQYDTADEDVKENCERAGFNGAKKPVPVPRFNCHKAGPQRNRSPNGSYPSQEASPHARGSEASIIITNTPTTVRIISGRIRRLSDGFIGGLLMRSQD